MTREELIANIAGNIADGVDDLLADHAKGDFDNEITHAVMINGVQMTIHMHLGHCGGAEDIAPGPVTLQ